ncbi:uncharacterized protein LOC123306875 [Coccinella septempunctata]|uniref:uncharacterized protein LOC123306875 n=1 Tax=Coccinella septempunctata TaxID=41139 RepID=UPI001D090F80|nr:uncharacterized protein LOC123306875 [Coccinella septempunctata]
MKQVLGIIITTIFFWFFSTGGAYSIPQQYDYQTLIHSNNDYIPNIYGSYRSGWRGNYRVRPSIVATTVVEAVTEKSPKGWKRGYDTYRRESSYGNVKGWKLRTSSYFR